MLLPLKFIKPLNQDNLQNIHMNAVDCSDINLPGAAISFADHRNNILIVDDVIDNLQFLARILAQQGYEVRCAINGFAALMAVSSQVPDLILLDIQMPDMDGYEVCRRLQDKPIFRDIPIIFLSANAQFENEDQGFEVGVKDYISKPFQTTEVLMRVKNYLDLHNTQLQLKQTQSNACKALAKEKAINRLQSEFISMVSHDFRTPLTSIQGFALLLRDSQDKLSQSQQRRFLNKIEASVEHMIQLLDRVMLSGQTDAGNLKVKPQLLNLKKFCVDLIETLQIITGEKCRILFTYEGQEQVYLDPNLLKIVLDNLLSNATKYSLDKSCIQLVLKCCTILHIQVIDEGIGIPQEDVPQLFDAFYRASNTMHLGGMGLGLAIVKKCIDAQAGTIEVESRIGKGTCFTVTLPIEKYAENSLEFKHN